MTPDELKATIERRGYTVNMEYYQGSVGFRISTGEKSVMRAYTLFDLSYVKITTHDLVESMLYALAQGWKHMACIQCGEPLLASFNWVDEPGVALKWYGVCSVKAGPYTEHLKMCPGCGVEFGGERGYPPPLREIQDAIGVL